uniref:BTB domain-containing protein n=1 Tax=Periophthalmus magnuspinnatus TaxID=409849 RepID=A0A3B4BBR7_9GOBI
LDSYCQIYLLLLQQLNVQREFGFLCDCTVAIGNVFFKAHRAVLAAFSNYFKMIFIHQSSECIKIQPSDIQPDVFSYLLHVMYTGMSPKQSVDQARLQDGIRFLHAYQLCTRRPHDPSDPSNLYGIQISSQISGAKEVRGEELYTKGEGPHIRGAVPDQRGGTTSQRENDIHQRAREEGPHIRGEGREGEGLCHAPGKPRSTTTLQGLNHFLM